MSRERISLFLQLNEVFDRVSFPTFKYICFHSLNMQHTDAVIYSCISYCVTKFKYQFGGFFKYTGMFTKPELCENFFPIYLDKYIRWHTFCLLPEVWYLLHTSPGRPYVLKKNHIEWQIQKMINGINEDRCNIPHPLVCMLHCTFFSFKNILLSIVSYQYKNPSKCRNWVTHNKFC